MSDLTDTPTSAFSPAMAVRGTVPGDLRGCSPPPPGCDAPKTFKLYRHGPVTVIGWSGVEEIDFDPADFQQEAADLVTGAGAQTLAIDLTRLEWFPPGLLGGLPALAKQGVRVLLFNPTEDVRELLRVARLDGALGVHDADLNG